MIKKLMEQFKIGNPKSGCCNCGHPHNLQNVCGIDLCLNCHAQLIEELDKEDLTRWNKNHPNTQYKLEITLRSSWERREDSNE